jgi:hypothetical protein
VGKVYPSFASFVPDVRVAVWARGCARTLHVRWRAFVTVRYAEGLVSVRACAHADDGSGRVGGCWDGEFALGAASSTAAVLVAGRRSPSFDVAAACVQVAVVNLYTPSSKLHLHRDVPCRSDPGSPVVRRPVLGRFFVHEATRCTGLCAMLFVFV